MFCVLVFCLTPALHIDFPLIHDFTINLGMIFLMLDIILPV